MNSATQTATEISNQLSSAIAHGRVAQAETLIKDLDLRVYGLRGTPDHSVWEDILANHRRELGELQGA